MGHKCCSKQKVKRGLWSPEEDEKLVNFITTHGHGSWSSVPKLAGLQRCGKSCRLRWINYLRPDLKRGSFTAQEEQIIIDVHRILGNRWAQIAKHLPGRTDNEVKNFWNSCIKKKLISQGLDPRTHNLIPAHQRSSKSSSCNNINISLPISNPHQQPFSIISMSNNSNSHIKDNPIDTLISQPITSNNIPMTSMDMPKYSLEHQRPNNNIWDTQFQVPSNSNNMFPWTPSCMDNITHPISTSTIISDSLANLSSGYGLLSEGSCMWDVNGINDNDYNCNNIPCNVEEGPRPSIVSLEGQKELQDQVIQQSKAMVNNMELDGGCEDRICLMQEMGATNSFDSSSFDHMEFVDSNLLSSSAASVICRDLTSMDDLAWNF